MKILIIDDSMSACMALDKILMDHAITYCCICSKSWKEHYKDRNPDIILLDIIMSGMDGVEVLKQIREINTEIPVIMVSAITDKNKIIECLNLGASGYIIKPISKDKVVKVFCKGCWRYWKCEWGSNCVLKLGICVSIW